MERSNPCGCGWSESLWSKIIDCQQDLKLIVRNTEVLKSQIKKLETLVGVTKEIIILPDDTSNEKIRRSETYSGSFSHENECEENSDSNLPPSMSGKDTDNAESH